MTAINNKRLVVALVVIITTMRLCWFTWSRKERVVLKERTMEQLINNVSLANSPQRKILYWGKYLYIPWKSAHSGFPQGNITCSGGVRCFLTCDERNFVSSDAVFIHSRTLAKIPPLSLWPPGQIWVFYTRESPQMWVGYMKKRTLSIWLWPTYANPT